MEKKLEVFNRTGKSAEEIEAMQQVGVILNNWRQRRVRLFKNADDDMLYMIGDAFDGHMRVISYEPIGPDERQAMSLFSDGRNLVML